MASGDFCEHDWPGSGCEECAAERKERAMEYAADDRKVDYPFTHYVHRNSGGSVFVKDADLFRKQGGLTTEWGKKWTGVIAKDDDDALNIAARIFKNIPEGRPKSTSDQSHVMSRGDRLRRIESVLTISSAGHAPAGELADMILTALDEPHVQINDLGDHMTLRRVSDYTALEYRVMAHILNEGSEARREGTNNPYKVNSIEHLLHAEGWLKEDLRLALIKADPKYAQSQLAHDRNRGQIDHAELGADAMKWAEAFVKITSKPVFDPSNFSDVDFMVGWFANAIEATRMADRDDRPDKEKELFKQGYSAGFKDCRRDDRRKSAWQDWVLQLPIMQQSVLAAAIRAPDGMRKHHPAKMLIRWYRRSVLLSAFDGRALLNPYEGGGGSFTGPLTSQYTEDQMADEFMLARDEMSLHYYAHMMHAAQIVGCYHPDDYVRDFWDQLYRRMVNALHLEPESYIAMAQRLSDDQDKWTARSDEAGSCSD